MDKADKKSRGEMSVTDPKRARKKARQAQKFADYSIKKTLSKEELEHAHNQALEENAKRDLMAFGAKLKGYSDRSGGIDKSYFENIAKKAMAGIMPGAKDIEGDTDPRDFVLDMMNRTFPKQIMKQYKGLSPSFDNYLNMNYDIHNEELDEVVRRGWKKGTYHVKDADGKIHGTYKSGSHASKAMHKLMDKGVHKELEVSRANEELELGEARKSDYQLYHKDFSSAMQHAYAVAKKRGYIVDKDDIDNKVATGPRKPSSGKTNRYILGTDKKQNLHVQVANLDNKRYELNMYIESAEGKDMEISEKGRLKLEKVLENRKKFVEPENRAGDHGTDELTKNYKEMTPGEEVTEGNIVANSRDPFRIFEHMVHYLMGTSIKNIEDYTFYKMEDVDNHIRLENKEGALCSIYLADVQNFFDDKDISMEDFISMITEFGVKELTEKEIVL